MRVNYRRGQVRRGARRRCAPGPEPPPRCPSGHVRRYRPRKQQLPWWADRDIVLPGQIAADTSETGTKATRGHFLNSFGEAVIIAELDHAAVAAERVAQLTEG